MAKISVSDAIRIIPREAEFLNRKSGLRGEIFYDQTANTLRIYNGSTVGGLNLAKGDLSNVLETDFVSLASSSRLFGPNIHIHNTVVNSNLISGDKDYVTFTVGTNSIAALYLTKYVGVDLKAFFAIQQGTAWTAGQDVNQMLTYGHLGPWDPSLDVGSNVLAGNPLHPGAVTLAANTTYTVWIQQTGSNITEYVLSTNPYWIPATADLPADYSGDPLAPTVLYQDGAGTGSGGTSVSVDDTAPSSPSPGNLWLDTNTGILYVYYDDGNSEQWIQPVFPYPDTTNLATVSYVNSTVAALPASAGLATTSFVTSAVSAGAFVLNVQADDSTTRSIPTGSTVQFNGSGGITTTSDSSGNITIIGGGTTGNVTFAVTTIDSSDSSAIRFTPAVIFDSDVTVQNNLVVDNSVDVALNLSVNNRLTVKDIVLTGNFSSQGSGIPELLSDSEIYITPGTTTILNGLTTFYEITEVLNTKTGATGTVTHDFSTGAVFYHSSISANFTANFTNVPTTNNRTLSVVLILSQGATARIPNAVQIAGVAQTILWQGGGIPVGSTNRVDVVSFTLIRTGNAWTVIGALTTYGTA